MIDNNVLVVNENSSQQSSMHKIGLNIVLRHVTFKSPLLLFTPIFEAHFAIKFLLNPSCVR